VTFHAFVIRRLACAWKRRCGLLLPLLHFLLHFLFYLFARVWHPAFPLLSSHVRTYNGSFPLAFPTPLFTLPARFGFAFYQSFAFALCIFSAIHHTRYCWLALYVHSAGTDIGTIVLAGSSYMFPNGVWIFPACDSNRAGICRYACAAGGLQTLPAFRKRCSFFYYAPVVTTLVCGRLRGCCFGRASSGWGLGRLVFWRISKTYSPLWTVCFNAFRLLVQPTCTIQPSMGLWLFRMLILCSRKSDILFSIACCLHH